MEITRIFEMPRTMTFQMPKLRAWVEAELVGETLNLFGGITRLPNSIHNEINEQLSADVRRDACDVTLWQDMEGRFDTIVLDPPYSHHQSVVSYGIKKAQKITHSRDVAEYVLKPHGKVISLGYNTTGMSNSRGFTKEKILIVNQGGSHSDILITVESR